MGRSSRARIRPTRWLALAVAALGLAGCATNTLTLERGGKVAAAGDNAVAASRSFVASVKAARDDANIAIVASDDSCAWASPLVLRGDLRPQPKPPARAPLCLPPGTPADPALGDVAWPLEPVSNAALKPMLGAIAALAAYLDAVNTIMGAEAPDYGAELGSAWAAAHQAQADFDALTRANPAVLPPLTDEQMGAIQNLLTMIGQLAAEQRQTDDLRRLVAAQNTEVGQTIAGLQGMVSAWGRASLEGDLQASDAAYVDFGRRMGASPPPVKGFEARQAALKRMVEARRKLAVAAALPDAVNESLGEMKAAQDQLFLAFGKDPQWTPEEAARAAQINRERLLAALHAVAAAAAAF